MRIKLTPVQLKAIKSIHSKTKFCTRKIFERVTIFEGYLYCTDIHRLVRVKLFNNVPDGEYDLEGNLLSPAEGKEMPASPEMMAKYFEKIGKYRYSISTSEIPVILTKLSKGESFVQLKYLSPICRDLTKMAVYFSKDKALDPILIDHEGVEWLIMLVRGDDPKGSLVCYTGDENEKDMEEK